MMRSWRRTVVTVALALGFLGCASERLVQVRESTTSEPLALKRVAIAPFRAAPRPGAGAVREDAGTLIASYVSEALAARGVDVVPPSDVEQALGAGGAEDRSVTQIVGDRFGADAATIGTVWRWRERTGAAMGSIHPASVGFEVKIFSAQTGKLLWAAVFDHTQVALGENALVAAQYPGGGTRWMTAEELARFGADRMVREIPLQ